MNGIVRLLDVVLKWSLLLLATAMILTVTWQVFSRYALQAPSSLTEEIARFQLVWLGLLGAVYAFRTRAHVRIDALVERFGTGTRRAAELVALAACLVFAVTILVIGGTHLVRLTYELQQTSAALGIGMAWVYAIVPVSGVLISIYCVHFALEALQAVDGHKRDSQPAARDDR